MPKSARRSPASGFTILELTLVLVVMGLVVVSILKGAPMVHQSRLRKSAQMVEDIRTASNLFYREQGRLPGDGGVGGKVAGLSVDGRIEGSECTAFIEELIANKYMIGTKSGSTWVWNHPFGGTISIKLIDKGTVKEANMIELSEISGDDDKAFFDARFDGDADYTIGPVRFVGSTGPLQVSL